MDGGVKGLDDERTNGDVNEMILKKEGNVRELCLYSVQLFNIWM